jgi:hypothetical protein
MFDCTDVKVSNASEVVFFPLVNRSQEFDPDVFFSRFCDVRFVLRKKRRQRNTWVWRGQHPPQHDLIPKHLLSHQTDLSTSPARHQSSKLLVIRETKPSTDRAPPNLPKVQLFRCNQTDQLTRITMESKVLCRPLTTNL